MKKPSKKRLKTKAWQVFARYIKVRDADKDGYCTCITCGKKIKWYDSTCHAGHFVGGRGNAVLFDDAFVFAQCMTCNVWNHGEQGKYTLFIKKHYGYDDATIEEILNKKFTTKDYANADYLDIIDRFSKEADRIMQEKGLNG